MENIKNIEDFILNGDFNPLVYLHMTLEERLKEYILL